MAESTFGKSDDRSMLARVTSVGGSEPPPILALPVLPATRQHLMHVRRRRALSVKRPAAARAAAGAGAERRPQGAPRAATEHAYACHPPKSHIPRPVALARDALQCRCRRLVSCRHVLGCGAWRRGPATRRASVGVQTHRCRGLGRRARGHRAINAPLKRVDLVARKCVERRCGGRPEEAE